MYVQTAFRNGKRIDALEKSAIEKIQNQVEKFVSKPIGMRVKFEDEGALHCVQCVLKAGDGLTIFAKEKSESFNEALDRVIYKVTRQLRKKKGVRLTERTDNVLRPTFGPSQVEDESDELEEGFEEES